VLSVTAVCLLTEAANPPIKTELKALYCTADNQTVTAVAVLRYVGAVRDTDQ
jgi:hypothetical protein